MTVPSAKDKGRERTIFSSLAIDIMLKLRLVGLAENLALFYRAEHPGRGQNESASR